MFLYEAAPWYSYAMWFLVLAALVGANELARLNKWVALGLFAVLPIALTIFVWPTTAGAGSSTGTWFHWVKVYSALAGCLGFLALRFIKGASANKWVLMFPPAILAINILEAVARDLQVWLMNADGIVDGVYMLSGPWNAMNAAAGLINIVTISGWMGIRLSKNSKQDMIWPDMIWPWIIAYDVWNFAYVYNCVGDHSFYAGAALLISCTIPTFFITKGTWMQARAQTLAFWMMFTMSVPAFVSTSAFAVQTSRNPAALFTVSALALAINVAVLVYHVYRIRTHKLNPLREEIYRGLPAYEEVAAANGPALGLGELPAPDDASSLTGSLAHR
ncbi:DUF5692 family protein [Janibacter sp. GXQ6167]|uniref:DUF5692 family protein n=1 Tax=Janibacter sp. GXQ6167 TaxID=3240791 RepID=UPI003526A535